MPAVAPVIEAVVLGLVVLEVGFTDVEPGAVTTAVLQA